MTEENRTILLESVREATVYQREQMANAEATLLQQLKDEGCNINEISPEVRKEMGEIMNMAIKDDIIKKCGQDVYNMVTKEVETQR